MKLSHSRSRRKAPALQRESAILFTVSGIVFAIAADAIDEVRNLDGLVPYATTSAYQRLDKVKFTLERQGSRYFVVDAGAHFGIPAAASPATRLMVMRSIPVAVLVGGIERMHDIGAVRPLPGAFHGDERRWYRGLAILKRRAVPVVNADAFLTRAEFTLLEGKCALAPKSIAAAGA